MSTQAPPHNLYGASALELRALLDAGEVSSVEVTEALIARREAVDGRLNALIHRFDEAALQAAREADERRARGQARGPLDGLPVTLKESIATPGTPVTLGVPHKLGDPSQAEAVIARLVREAGMVVLGKTNVPELLLFHETDNEIWGRTVNPWAPDRAPGGSSGGEAAALAAGLTPLGVGTDIGGSIRVPAAFSGVTGLKPTVDRWSNAHSHTALAGQEVVRGQCGPMARRAADVAWFFRALDSPRHSPLDPAVPPVVTPDPAAVDLRGLTVGFYTDDGYLAPAQSIQRAVREAADALAERGATVVPFAPPRQPELLDLYFAALSSDGGATAREHLQGRPPVAQLKPLFATARLPTAARRAAATVMGLRGERRVQRLLRALGAKPVERYWQLTSARTALRLDVFDAWAQAGVDLVVCPAHATPALKHGQAAEFSVGASYSMRYNLLNFPAGVVPVTRARPDEEDTREVRDRIDRTAAEVERGSAGLPVGVQVVARPYAEHLVLAAMMAIEAEVRGDDAFPHTPTMFA